jgi:hypothetical protein
MDCGICCEKFTKTLRKQIECPSCSKSCCIECIKRYVLENTGEPNCLFCKVGFVNDFVRETFTISFLNNEYKMHRRLLLFDIEKSKLPNTIEYLDVYNEINSYIELKRKIAEEYYQTRDTYSSVSMGFNKTWLKYKDTVCHDVVKEEDVQNLNTWIKKEVTTKLKHFENENRFHVYNSQAYTTYIRQLNEFLKGELGIHPVFHYDPSQKREYDQKYICSCIKKDCKGFIGSNGKCMICNIEICKDCHEETTKKKEHECDPDTKKTIELMKSDTKPCPKCASPIFRISGCNQMWCVVCHVSFNWTTGKISAGRVHNPEYFRYLQENGGGNVQLELNCNQRLLDDENSTRFINSNRLTLLPQIRKIRRIFNVLLDVHERVLPRAEFSFKGNIQDPHIFNRIKYMKNEISKDNFMQCLTTLENKLIKIDNMNQILTMYIDVTDEHLKAYIECTSRILNDATITTTKDIHDRNYKDYLPEILDIMKSMENIRKYTNECFINRAIMYKQKNTLFIPDYSSIDIEISVFIPVQPVTKKED